MPSISERCRIAYANKDERLPKIDRSMQDDSATLAEKLKSRTDLIEREIGNSPKLIERQHAATWSIMDFILELPVQPAREEFSLLSSMDGFKKLHHVCAGPDIDCKIELERRYLRHNGEIEHGSLQGGRGDIFIVISLDKKYAGSTHANCFREPAILPAAVPVSPR